MAIEKSLYQAPVGIDEEVESEEAIEIEVVDPESMSIKMDGVEIDIEPRELGETDFNANIAEHMDESELTSLGSDLTSDVENDENSRKDWADMLVKGLEVLGIKYEERTEPWNGACGIFSTLPQSVVDGFEKIFGTPHGRNLVAIAKGFGVEATEVRSIGDLLSEVLKPIIGLSVVVALVPSREMNAKALKDLYLNLA